MVSVVALVAIGGCMATGAEPCLPNAQNVQLPVPQALSSPPPGDTLVDWVGNVCYTTRSLTYDPFRLSGSESAEMERSLLTYVLRVAPIRASVAVLELKTLPLSGVRGGDEFVASFVRALKDLQIRLNGLAEGAGSLAMEVLRERLRQAKQMLASLKPDGPDLAALMAGDPVLARAHELAPECHPDPSRSDPPTPRKRPTSDAPLPPAADGSDVSACRDGTCEISVSAPTDIVIGGGKISLTEVTGDRVSFHQESADTTISAGHLVYPDDVGIVGIRVVAVHNGTALLRIATL